MATTTFKPIVLPSERKQDGTYNVKIRVTHNRRSKRISTHLFACPDDLVRANFKIKNRKILDTCEDMIKDWREKINKLGMGASAFSVEEIVDYIFADDTDSDFRLDFIKFGRKVADSKSAGTSGNYHTALNCLVRFLDNENQYKINIKRGTNGEPDIDISEVTAKFLERFEDFIVNEPVLCYNRTEGTSVVDKKKSRAVSSYMESLRHIHNRAKWEYNDEDLGKIRIPQSPFAKYRIKKAPAPHPKPISVESLQTIINLPDYYRKDGPPGTVTRRDLARDCFLMSFAMAGMNAADLYDCSPEDFDRKEMIITYGRKKTRTRRDDGAIMKIRVESCILPLIEKYLNDNGNKLFKFAEYYNTPGGFNNALRYGLKQIQAIIEEKEFVFYSARYSWATIGRSKDVGIDKYTIHEGLNHVDDQMKITDGYIKKDFRPIWDANFEILKQFDWSVLTEREAKRAVTTAPLL